MTFQPAKSLRVREDFDIASGHSPTDNLYQGVTGGYVTLLPIVERSTSYLQPWLSITGWHLNNGMATRAIVSGSFYISGGRYVAGHGGVVSGYQQVTPSAGGWEIYTPPLLGTGTSSYSGQQYQYIISKSGSPYSGYHESLYPTKNPITLEMDIMSLYTISTGDLLPGFVTGQRSLSGLPALTGVLNHGIYLSDGIFWDYLEVRPDGIRSFNHPELAIPMDFASSPTKVRLGLENRNIFILTEDGRSVAGISRFDTPLPVAVSGSPRLAFGAPHTGYEFGFTGATAFVGRSTWDNIKILTGSLRVTLPTGIERLYNTGTYTFYTNPYEPSLPIQEYLYASVGYASYRGGTTTVTAQYSGTSGYIDIPNSAITLSPGDSPKPINLSLTPIFQTAGSTGITSSTPGQGNSLRFKIVQQSTNGSAPPPAVDYIEVAASLDVPLLDIVPNWKLNSISTKINFGLRTGDFYSMRPGATAYTTAFFISPESTGLYTGAFSDATRYASTGYVMGTGEIVSYGAYDTSFQTYTLVTATAQSGSEAAALLGTTPTNNLFFNGALDNGYGPVDTISGFISGYLEGVIAVGLNIRSGYSGIGRIYLDKVPVFRSSSATTAPSYGQDQTDFAQNYIYIPTGSLSDPGSLEVVIPSGIMNGTCFGSFDLKIARGSGLYFYIKNYTGLDVGNRRYLSAYYFSGYRNVKIPFNITDSGRYYLGLSASGSTIPVEYTIDNISVSPYRAAYLKITGVPPLTHEHVGDMPFAGTPQKASRAVSIAEGTIQLESYPTGSSGIFIQKLRDSDSKGLTFFITSGGYPVVEVDLSDSSWFTGVGQIPIETYLMKKRITGEARVPLGILSHLGFMHEVWAFKSLGGRNFSGQDYSYNMASCNRGYITINGQLVASEDLMDFWNSTSLNSASGDLAPWVSYVTEGTGTCIIGSGLLAKIDNIGYHRYPVAEAESFLGIRCAKQSLPYFVPDIHLRPYNEYDLNGTVVNNRVNDSARLLANWSIYNFSNPTTSLGWDHGPIHNHALFYGQVTRDTLTPYTGYSGSVYSANFSGGYGLLKYSSSTERLINYPGKFTGCSSTGLRDYGFGGPQYHGIVGYVSNMNTIIGTWLYPRTTGAFLEIVKDINYPTGEAIIFGISGGLGSTSGWFYVCHRNELQTLNWQHSTLISNPYSGWVHVGADMVVLDAGSNLTAPTITTYINGSGNTSSLGFIFTGSFDYIGRSGSYTKSAIYLGRIMNCNMTDLFLGEQFNGIAGTGIVNWSGAASRTGDKRGSYQGLFLNNEFYSGLHWSGFYRFPSIVLPAVTGSSDKTIWIGCNNLLDNTVPYTDGFTLTDRAPFREVVGYYYSYDDTPLKLAFGDTNSPIRLGYVVPPNAINIARIDSPEFNTTASISSIDLSDRNTNNLSSYRGGEYALTSSMAKITGSVASGSFKGINSRYLSGQGDITYSGQLDTSNIRVTSFSIARPEIDQPSEAFFCYLVGRGDWGLQISDAFPHITGGLDQATTGNLELINNYISNMDKVRASITLKDSKGQVIPVSDFPWDVIPGQINPAMLRLAVLSGKNIEPDGIGIQTGDFIIDPGNGPLGGAGGGGSSTGPSSSTTIDSLSTRMPDGVFSAVIITTKQIHDDTVWVHYPAYRFMDGKVDRSHREILNPVPIFRRRLDFETAMAGQFSTDLDPDRHKKYLLTVYGIYSGVTGEF